MDPLREYIQVLTRPVNPCQSAPVATNDVKYCAGGAVDHLCGVMQADRPFLGICLGLHMLFDGSDENGGVEGLGIIPGQVKRFDDGPGLPVPHIGWNTLQQR